MHPGSARLPTASFSITSKNSSILSGLISASTTMLKGLDSAEAVLIFPSSNEQNRDKLSRKILASTGTLVVTFYRKKVSFVSDNIKRMSKY